MSFEFKLPDIGEGLKEGEVVKWLVKEGDTVTADQPMVEVMTDKATVEITAPKAGKIEKIHAAEGQTIPVGSVMVVIGDGAGGGKATASAAPAAAAPAAAPAKAAPAPAKAPAGNGKAAAAPAKPAPKGAPAARAAAPAQAADEEPVGAAEGRGREAADERPPSSEEHEPQPVGASSRVAPAAAPRRERTLAAPATRRMAREMGVDLAVIPATGPNGRVTRTDVETFAKRGPDTPAEAPARAPAPGRPAAPGAAPKPAPRAPLPSPVVSAEDEHVAIRGMRARIAEQMTRSKQMAPHFMLAEEIDVTELVHLRETAKPAAEAEGIKLTYLPFVMKALVSCFRRFPILNAVVDDAKSEYVVRKEYNVGIATDTADGLTVPVVKGVDRRSVLDLAFEIDRLVTAARDKKIALEDLKGGTFTITSAGSIGGTLATPILNYPEVSILGVYRIVERPVVRNGQIVVRSMMNVSTTHDHRIVDGATAARFLGELKRLLETPGLMLL